MVKKVCSAGVAGSISYVVVDFDGQVRATIRDEDKEFAADHVDMDSATNWLEKRVNDLIGKRYEAD